MAVQMELKCVSVAVAPQVYHVTKFSPRHTWTTVTGWVTLAMGVRVTVFNLVPVLVSAVLAP